MRGRRGLISLFLVAASVLAGCNRPSSYRYKMTVEVETPQGLVAGHSVRQVSFYWRPQGGYGAQVRGEAVAVDLPRGQTLFALLRDTNGDPDYASWIADWALKSPLGPGGGNAGFEEGRFAELYPTAPETQSPLGQTKGPMLVRFRDAMDPKSLVRVEYTDLAASFGPGVRLKRITVETTHENVTRGLQQRLPWLNNLQTYRADPANPFTSTLPREIGGLVRR